jgi:hypothetical protein
MKCTNSITLQHLKINFDATSTTEMMRWHGDMRRVYQLENNMGGICTVLPKNIHNVSESQLLLSKYFHTVYYLTDTQNMETYLSELLTFNFCTSPLGGGIAQSV